MLRDAALALLSERSPVHLPESLIAGVIDAYAGEERAYHDVTHLLEVTAHHETVARGPGWRSASETYLALLFHDAIYVAGTKDNEARSAELARTQLAGLPFDVERIEGLIALTASHGRVDRAALDEDARLFCDCDMAILGATPERYDAYEAAIAREYAVVPAPIFQAGRQAFLRALLGTPRIYLSDFFQERFEGPARDNLRRALDAHRVA